MIETCILVTFHLQAKTPQKLILPKTNPPQLTILNRIELIINISKTLKRDCNTGVLL